MKGALSDRFLLALLSIFLLASIIFAYFIFEVSAINLVLGQNLTDQQKARAIDIALSDQIVKDEATSRAGQSPYHVKGVLNPIPFNATGPDAKRYGALPAVEIVLGDESLKGMNMLAFVDLRLSRVAYIGYTKRADMYDQVPQWEYPNISIAQTNYVDGQVLTGEQREKAIRIALNDRIVQENMGGRNYTVQGDVAVTNTGLLWNDSSYVGAYPFITFTQGTSMYEPDFLIYVVVDVDKGKVLNTMMVVRTPVQRESPTPAITI